MHTIIITLGTETKTVRDTDIALAREEASKLADEMQDRLGGVPRLVETNDEADPTAKVGVQNDDERDFSFRFEFESKAEQFAEIYADVCERRDSVVTVVCVPACFVDEMFDEADRLGGVQS